MITNHFSEHRDLTFINQESWSFACYNIYKNNCETRQEGFVIIHSNNELLTKIWIDHDTCDNSGRRNSSIVQCSWSQMLGVKLILICGNKLFIQKWSLGRISKIPSLQQKNIFNHYDVFFREDRGFDFSTRKSFYNSKFNSYE